LRQQAAQHGLPVPEVVDAAADSSWLCERHLTGAPLNRLPDRAVAHHQALEVARCLATFSNDSRHTTTIADYHDELLGSSHQILGDIATSSLGQKTARVLSRIREQLAPELDQPIDTSIAHGDFQPANLLWDGAKTWLIDWEFSGRRQHGYDALVFSLHTRHPTGLATRLDRFIDAGATSDTLTSCWRGTHWKTAAERRTSILLLALEEVTLSLREGRMCGRVLHPGLRMLLAELGSWLDQARTPAPSAGVHL